MNKVFIKLVKFYQIFISNLFPNSCRYYPTCSQYAIWQLKHNNIIKSFIFILLRILRCNQLFTGGIDYPKINKKFTNSIFKTTNQFIKPKFWFIPYSKNNYYIIESIL